MKRKDAERLIERIRIAVAQGDPVAEVLLEAGIAPLVPCAGEAHSNAYIDNCGHCAPRWGFVGERVVIR